MAMGGGEDVLSEELFDENCTVCFTKQKMRKSVCFCSDCKKNMCTNCVRIHNDFIEDHTVVDGYGDDNLGKLLTEKCDKHKDEFIKFYCKQHAVIACNTCVVLEHNTCKGLKHIPESSEELRQDTQSQGNPERLELVVSNIDRIISSLDDHESELLQTEKHYLDEVEALTKKLSARTEELKANAKKDLIAKQKGLVSEAREKRDACLNVKKQIINCINRKMEPGQRKSHVFIMEIKGNTLADKADALCIESDNLTRGSKLVFKFDPVTDIFLKDVHSLGRVLEKHSVSLMNSVDLKSKENALQCNILDCCLFDDENVLLIDLNYEDGLMQVHLSTSTTKHHLIFRGIRAVAHISPMTVAIINDFSNAVEVVSMTNDRVMKRTKAFSLDNFGKGSRSIAHDRGELFIANTTCVFVYDMGGRLKRTILENMSDIGHIALSPSGKRIYVTDWDNGLVCTDRTGKIMFRLSAERLGLSCACGIVTDQLGRILVSGKGSNNIVEVTDDGVVLGQILSETGGLDKPGCMCYDPSTSRLYVGGFSSKLLVYKLYD